MANVRSIRPLSWLMSFCVSRLSCMMRDISIFCLWMLATISRMRRVYFSRRAFEFIDSSSLFCGRRGNTDLNLKNFGVAGKQSHSHGRMLEVSIATSVKQQHVTRWFLMTDRGPSIFFEKRSRG